MKAVQISGILLILSVFLIGFISAHFVEFYLYEFNNKSISAPSNYLDAENILVYEDHIVLNIEGARISNYKATGSMIPVLNENANGISVKPSNENDIEIGDIISFWRNGELIVHRVVDKGNDGEGVYFITKGDNSSVTDGKIRFSDIEHVLVGLIY